MGSAAACCAPASFRTRPGPSRRRGRRTDASASGSDAESFRRIVRHPRTAQGPDGTLLYFGYGANIAASSLRQKGVSPSASAVARAPGYELVFAHRGGYATIDPVEAGGACWGVVHRVSRTELAVIRAWETGYETKELDVIVVSRGETRETRAVRALAFVTKPSARLRKPVPPFDAYAAKLARGAETAGLPAPHVAFLRAAEEAAPPRAARGPEHFDVPSPAERLKGKLVEAWGRHTSGRRGSYYTPGMTEPEGGKNAARRGGDDPAK